MKNVLKLNEDDFIRFVVCPKCHAIYRFEECFTDTACKIPRLCSACEYPHHPHRSRRLPCGAKLLAEVTLTNNCRKYYPCKVYCYKPLKDSLRTLVSRVGFLTSYELWHLRKPLQIQCVPFTMDRYDKNFNMLVVLPSWLLPIIWLSCLILIGLHLTSTRHIV